MGITLAVFCVVLLYQADYWRRGALALGVLGLAGIVLMQQFGAVENRFGEGLTKTGRRAGLLLEGGGADFSRALVVGRRAGELQVSLPNVGGQVRAGDPAERAQ